MSTRRYRALLAIGLVTAIGLTASPMSAKAEERSWRHFSGIEVVASAPGSDGEPMSDQLGEVYDRAVSLAEQQPDAFGYPQIDQANERVVVSRTAQAKASLVRPLETLADASEVEVSSRVVSTSWVVLESKRNAITGSSDLPDAELIWTVEADGARNRVLLTLSELSDRLLLALADRYGSTDIAVRVEPSEALPSTGTNARPADTAPFFGGAQVRTLYDGRLSGNCTSGFPWRSGSTDFMLTAGHCAPNGGLLGTPAQAIGNVTASSRENWSPTLGSRYLTGQSSYRGDLALAQNLSGRASGTKIYRGGPTSASSSTVKEMWSRSPGLDDQYCVGGQRAGELCGWRVVKLRYDQRYVKDGANVWARNVYRGRKTGPCTLPGDSGGPVFTVRSDGKIAAKGIHSGSNGVTTGNGFVPCDEYFSDIRDAYYALPGSLKVGS